MLLCSFVLHLCLAGYRNKRCLHQLQNSLKHGPINLSLWYIWFLGYPSWTKNGGYLIKVIFIFFGIDFDTKYIGYIISMELNEVNFSVSNSILFPVYGLPSTLKMSIGTTSKRTSSFDGETVKSKPYYWVTFCCLI